MSLSSYLEVSIVGPEIPREGLQRLLEERGFKVRSWPYPAIREMMKTIGDGNGHLVILVGSASSGSNLPENLRRDAPLARLVAIADEPSAELTDLLDCTVPGSVSLDSVAAILDRLCHKSPPRDAIRLPPAEAGEIAAPAKLGEKLLSTREVQILCCLADGYSNKQVARELDITEATVKVHVKTVLRKLHLMNRTQAAIWAVQNGFMRDRNHARSPANIA